MGRQAEALAAYERMRARLADELGVDPSAELQAIHLAVLRGELGARPDEPCTPPRTNLKAQLTSFVGREDEVARIGKSLEENRLVTLVGPGGAGKTRLAVEAAAGLVDGVPDGIWLVELAIGHRRRPTSRRPCSARSACARRTCSTSRPSSRRATP